MFSTRVRLLFIAAALAVGGYRLYDGDSTGAYFLAVAVLFTYGYFRYGPVWLAFAAVQGGKLERASYLLSQVRFPNMLASQQRAYFEMASGIVSSSEERNVEAEQHFRDALRHEPRTDNDRGLAEAALGELLAKQGSRSEALELLSNARNRGCKPIIMEEIVKLIEELGPVE